MESFCCVGDTCVSQNEAEPGTDKTLSLPYADASTVEPEHGASTAETDCHTRPTDISVSDDDSGFAGLSDTCVAEPGTDQILSLPYAVASTVEPEPGPSASETGSSATCEPGPDQTASLQYDVAPTAEPGPSASETGLSATCEPGPDQTASLQYDVAPTAEPGPSASETGSSATCEPGPDQTSSSSDDIAIVSLLNMCISMQRRMRARP